MMKNGGAETGKDARTRQSNARNSSETSRKRNAEFDFDGLVRSYLDKDGFANRESERKLIAALEADPSGNALLNTEKGEAGKKQKIVGSLKKEFEKQLGKLTDVPGGVIAVRKILVREILARKREIVAKETANAARKSSLAKILKAEYVLSADEIRRTDAHLEKAKPEDVANALRNGEKREDFIWNALGRPNKMPEISSRMEHISKIGVKKAGESDGPEVTERAKKIALWQKAILSGRLTDEQAADIIREFQNPEDRKILVRTLIPNSDLGTLVEKGFVSAEEARKTVRKATEDLIAAKKGSDATFSSLSPEDVAKIVASVNLKDVPVPVDDLPDAVLKGFVSEVALTGRLAERLREEVNRGMRD
ncbi:MAG: hypothetical protein QG650_762, partial [Patescibacteria group bacterium]|nr:hypothetical protein [Patescibacteria group bacterium]